MFYQAGLLRGEACLRRSSNRRGGFAVPTESAFAEALHISAALCPYREDYQKGASNSCDVGRPKRLLCLTQKSARARGHPVLFVCRLPFTMPAAHSNSHKRATTATHFILEVELLLVSNAMPIHPRRAGSHHVLRRRRRLHMVAQTFAIRVPRLARLDQLGTNTGFRAAPGGRLSRIAATSPSCAGWGHRTPIGQAQYKSRSSGRPAPCRHGAANAYGLDSGTLVPCEDCSVSTCASDIASGCRQRHASTGPPMRQK